MQALGFIVLRQINKKLVLFKQSDVTMRIVFTALTLAGHCLELYLCFCGFAFVLIFIFHVLMKPV